MIESRNDLCEISAVTTNFSLSFFLLDQILNQTEPLDLFVNSLDNCFSQNPRILIDKTRDFEDAGQIHK